MCQPVGASVLAGANMQEWIAKDRLEYIKLAREHGARVVELRANRDRWRRQLQAMLGMLRTSWTSRVPLVRCT